ncbi:unnamed protein product [Durusdinium trenchii]|uniref:Uncharacterized protein n=1 Tax=Durusdinium trenchii TaxID=1381693 RepID=A0ABP0K5W1_9DINO
MGCFSSRPEPNIELVQPMWVMKATDFVKMELPLPSHEHVRKQGLLHRRKRSFYCIFISHQWVSSEHPDPEGKQLAVLQECLTKICDGSIEVMNDAASQLFGDIKRLSPQQQARLQEAYIWLDWISIPQIRERSTSHGSTRTDSPMHSISFRTSLRSFRFRTTSTTTMTEQEKYILSIPSFVQACQVFVALVPPVPHWDTDQLCNYSSWFTRGWCRTELWCKMMLGNQDMPILVISGGDKADFARPVNWVDCLPHEGDFSYDGDLSLVTSIFEQALAYKLLWLQMEGNWDLYRYFLARRESLIGQALEKRALGEFLEDFHFDVDAKTTTMSPLLCACLSGDLQLVKTLLQQEGLNLHTPLKSMMQVGIAEGLTALHVLLMHGWRCPGVLEVVLEAKADVNLVSKGIPVLAYCRSSEDVELLVKHQADVNKAAPPLGVPVLALATGENCKPEVIDSLLEARADPNGRSGGIGATQPLALLSMNAASNPHAMEVAKMLVLAKSDINQVCRASGLFYGLELLNRTYLRFARPRSNLMLLTAEWSTTPLGFACMFGNRQLVELLLKARGDLHRRNARGHTPLQLAKSQEVIDAIEDYIQDEEALLWHVHSSDPVVEWVF